MCIRDSNDTIQASPELNRVPILGNVSCGLPEYAEENFEEYVPLPVALFGQGDFYLLRASGNSMIEAGIDPGDLVVVRKQNTAEEGDIVVALVDNETCLLYTSELPGKDAGSVGRLCSDRGGAASNHGYRRNPPARRGAD